NPSDIADMAELMPDAHAELMTILRTLEAHYKDMQDTEFTVEEGALYMLQTRNAKRPAQAAVRFAVDAVAEGLLSREQALTTIDAGKLDALLHPTFDPHAEIAVLARGVPASPGAAKGEVVFTAPEAVEAAAAGRDVVLVRPFTEADDVAGFHAARGILTSEGGKASHAALVARGMGRPCVCGASELEIDVAAGTISMGDTTIARGDRIAIDGSEGTVTLDDVPLVEARWSQQFETVLTWCDELRTLGVRANADTPEDARRAREYGAEGIGLCRTEHMFMAADRQPKMRTMIMAEDEQARRDALAELLPLQQHDFEGLFEAMESQPVTIRLLDPPLHEFLPHRLEVEHAIERGRAAGEDVADLERTLERVQALEETNPMLGTRGCRLGILYPEVYEMQADAIARAAIAVRERTGKAPLLEVMIPLVDYESELELMRKLVADVARERGLEVGRDFLVGTMIELPRACFLADSIAHHADFFSFGTNDLTQTALGFSRDDVESKFLQTYLERKIVDRSPFETIDAPGVGQMVRMGAWLGRKTKQDLKLGVCGEHGGDPESIDFFHHSGIDYVSCSPFRVPVARVAAAQAVVAERLGAQI
ncbi:MAG TPA: putative PEP-binding protein, partial [Conexibacter sp.]|nr:putative PEP-binding protein [Conexibacter sp.]